MDQLARRLQLSLKIEYRLSLWASLATSIFAFEAFTIGSFFWFNRLKHLVGLKKVWTC